MQIIFSIRRFFILKWRISAWTRSVNGSRFADFFADACPTHPFWLCAQSPPFTQVMSAQIHSDTITHCNQLFLLEQYRKSLTHCKVMWFTVLFENKVWVLSRSKCTITVQNQQCKSWSGSGASPPPPETDITFT